MRHGGRTGHEDSGHRRHRGSSGCLRHRGGPARGRPRRASAGAAASSRSRRRWRRTASRPTGVEVVVGDVLDADAVAHRARRLRSRWSTRRRVFSLDSRRAQECCAPTSGRAELVLGLACDRGLDPVVHVSSTVALTGRQAAPRPSARRHPVAVQPSKIASEIVARRLQDAGPAGRVPSTRGRCWRRTTRTAATRASGCAGGPGGTFPLSPARSMHVRRRPGPWPLSCPARRCEPGPGTAASSSLHTSSALGAVPHARGGEGRRRPSVAPGSCVRALSRVHTCCSAACRDGCTSHTRRPRASTCTSCATPARQPSPDDQLGAQPVPSPRVPRQVGRRGRAEPPDRANDATRPERSPPLGGASPQLAGPRARPGPSSSELEPTRAVVPDQVGAASRLGGTSERRPGPSTSSHDVEAGAARAGPLRTVPASRTVRQPRGARRRGSRAAGSTSPRRSARSRARLLVLGRRLAAVGVTGATWR